jgi:hypothetical protein
MYFSSSSNAKVGSFKMFSLKKIKIAFYLNSTKGKCASKVKGSKLSSNHPEGKEKKTGTGKMASYT